MTRPTERRLFTILSLACFLLSVCHLLACSEAEKPRPTVVEQPSLKANTVSATNAAGPRSVPGPSVDNEDELELYGLGEAPRGKNISLSRSTAANRARADLANKLRAAGQLGKHEPLPSGVNVQFEDIAKRIRARASLPTAPK